MFRRYPEPVRQACIGLIVGGFLFLVFAGMGFYLMASEPLDNIGKILTLFLGGVALAGIVTGFLLASRASSVMPLAWITALLFLLVFPLGTIVGFIVIQGLTSKEMKTFLQRGPTP